MILILESEGHSDHTPNIEAQNHRSPDTELMKVQRVYILRHGLFVVSPQGVIRVPGPAIIDRENPVSPIGEGLHNVSERVPCLRITMDQYYRLAIIAPLALGVDIDIMYFDAVCNGGRVVFPPRGFLERRHDASFAVEVKVES